MALKILSRPMFEGKLPAQVEEHIGKIVYRHGRIRWGRSHILSDPSPRTWKKYKKFNSVHRAKIEEHTASLAEALSRAAKGKKSLRNFLKGARYSYIDKNGSLRITDARRGIYPRMDNSALLGRA